MNTDKTINEEFLKREEYPVWYYKKLEEIKVDDVIWDLLKETFVVEIEGVKHEITFGKNRKGEIGECIKYNDIKNSNLCSFEVVDKGFREGKWFRITELDTTKEFKVAYEEEKKRYDRSELEKWYREALINIVNDSKDISDKTKQIFIEEIKNISYTRLEELVKSLFKNSEK